MEVDMVAKLVVDTPPANSHTDTDTHNISHGQPNYLFNGICRTLPKSAKYRVSKCWRDTIM